MPEGQVVHPKESHVAQVVAHREHTPPLKKVPLKQTVQAKGEGLQLVQLDNIVKHETALLVVAS